MPAPSSDAPAGFRPVAAAPTAGQPRYGPDPFVLRGAARDWPAVRTWTFGGLAARAPDRPVQVVDGNREADPTRFAGTTLARYLTSLAGLPEPEEPHEPEEPNGSGALYLKEFDLLSAIPGLRADLRPQTLFPRGVVRQSSAWIGPAGARTGLHCDLPDNVAVQVIGRKRFLLCSPGSVRRNEAHSTKYDAWARLSAVGAAELAARDAANPAPGPRSRFLVADLEPGDALYVPRGWWHEVVNLSPSVLLSGFFGSPARLGPLWLAVTARTLLHRAGLTGRHGCTCHASLSHR